VRAGSEDYLAKAYECLSEARQTMAIGLLNLSARCGYYAIFHAAEALILDRTGKVGKTHSGVRSEFARLTRNMSQADTALLAQAYKYKAADYDIHNELVLAAPALQGFIDQCSHFVCVIETMLSSSETGIGE
jgi:uncharacterized protein (UPF0332 family)